VLQRRYPGDTLLAVFDIDGTILDMRYVIHHVLSAYDRDNGTSHFEAIEPEDVFVHEARIGDFLQHHGLGAAERQQVENWYRRMFWSAEIIRRAHQPFDAVFDIIRWFQDQPRTAVALNTGRPEFLRRETLASLDDLGLDHGVSFRSDLLSMNPKGWDGDVTSAKADGLRRFQDAGYRVFAVVDNEPDNIAAMQAADRDAEILFLHADTIFLSEPAVMPRTVGGRDYGLARLLWEYGLSAEAASA
jgi:hypothetical protein